MKKGRSIVREIRSSESFGALTYRQRDLFQGLIEVADDQGRLPGTAAAVRSEVWKYDEISTEEVQAELDQLANCNDPFIVIYQAHGKTYIQIINWWKYQQMAWAQASAYPAPKGWRDKWRVQGLGKKVMAQDWDKPAGFIDQHLEQVDAGVEPGVDVGVDAGVEPVVAGYLEEVVNINNNHKENNKDNEKENNNVNNNTPPPSQNLTLEQAEKAWEYAKGELLQDGMSKANYDAWLANLQVSHVSGSLIMVKAINRFAVDWVSSHCKPTLEQRIRAFLDRSDIELMISAVELVVEKPPGRVRKSHGLSSA